MIKFYIDSVIQHPWTGEADHKIIEVIADVPELEKVLFVEKRCRNCGEDRKIIDVKLLDRSERGE